MRGWFRILFGLEGVGLRVQGLYKVSFWERGGFRTWQQGVFGL